MALSFGSIGTIATSIASLFDSGTKGVTLGGVVLQGIQAPEKIGWGGDQKLVIHRYGGGQRLVQAMGPDDRDIDFSFVLLGPQAVSDAHKLDAIRVAGKAVQLTWPGEIRTVVMRNFQPNYENAGGLMSCQVSLVVIPSTQSVTANPSLLDSITSDISNALGLKDFAPALQQAQGYLQQAQKLLPIVGVIAPKSLGVVAGTLASANGIVSGGLSLADGKMAGFITAGTAAGNLAGGFGAVGAASQVTAAAAAAKQLAGISATVGFSGRATQSAATAAATAGS